jgi:hypothetical protein
MKSNNNNNDDDDDDNNNNNNNTAMGSVHARGDTFLTFGLKALTEMNTSRLATGIDTSTQMEPSFISEKYKFWTKNAFTYCPKKISCKNTFSHNCLLQLL